MFGGRAADESSMRVFAVLFALVLASGCFLDEIDKAMETMPSKKHAKVEKEPEPEAPAEPSPSGAEDPGFFSSLLGLAEEQLESEPAPPDPAELPVRCWMGKREHFSTRSDCESRGGRPVDLPAR
jgi:hypothetical protein